MFPKTIERLSGLEQWQRVLYIMLVAQFVTATGFSTANTFLPLYIDSLPQRSGLSLELMAGLLYSVPAFSMMISSPLWGVLADRYGRKMMVQRSMYGGAIVIPLMGFAQFAEQLVLLRGIQGMLTGTLAAASALLAATTPRNRSGYAMAVLQVGLLAGIALGPLLGGVVADVFGYRTAFIGASILLAISGILVQFGIKEERGEQTTASRTESDGFFRQLRKITKIPGILLVYLLRFISELARIIMLPILPLFVLALVSADAPVNTITGIVVATASFAGTASAIYLGRLGDRIGHKRILALCALTAGLLYLAQSRVLTVWQLVALQILLGIAGGGILPIVSALLAQYVQAGQEGGAYGLDNSIRAAAGVTAPMLGGVIAYWLDLRSVFIATGVVLVLMAAIAALKLPALNHDEAASDT